MPENTGGTCFVVMGFGKKTDFETGRTIDLDKSYRNMIKPAVEAAGLQCIRADEIVHSGMIDVPMYEQLLNADVVVADLSTSNKNAYYELGVRHALRPSTTVIVAEDGIKTFPFDVNHVAVRQYHHLGEDIGFDEVMRFRDLLTKAIVEIQKKDPRANDSPVYTLLHGLNPPALGAKPKAAQDPDTGSTAAQAATHSMLILQAEDAQTRSDFVTAKSLLTVIRGLRKSDGKPEDPDVIQRLALVTYKSKLPTEEAALHEAHDLLVPLLPESTNDTATLSLWGAVHKRLWGLTHSRQDLDDAIHGYDRGFRLRNDYYNGINLAYLLNVRSANQADPAEAITDFVQARRVRKEVIAICEQWLADNPAPENASSEAIKQSQRNRYWVLATLGEALIGLQDETKGNEWLEKAFATAPERWMEDSTREQIGQLKPLLENSPLQSIKKATA